MVFGIRNALSGYDDTAVACNAWMDARGARQRATYGVESCSFKGDALQFFSVWRLQKIDDGTKKMMCALFT